MFAFTAAEFKAEVVRGAILIGVPTAAKIGLKIVQSGPGNAASSVRRRFGSDIVGR